MRKLNVKDVSLDQDRGPLDWGRGSIPIPLSAMNNSLESLVRLSKVTRTFSAQGDRITKEYCDLSPENIEACFIVCYAWRNACFKGCSSCVVIERSRQFGFAGPHTRPLYRSRKK